MKVIEAKETTPEGLSDFVPSFSFYLLYVMMCIEAVFCKNGFEEK